MQINTSRLNKLLLVCGLSLFVTTGRALAGVPSSAEPTPAVEAGRPDAKVSPYIENESAQPREQRSSSETRQNK
jgi:hypothetical protein